jgi:hypothetical protein
MQTKPFKNEDIAMKSQDSSSHSIAETLADFVVGLRNSPSDIASDITGQAAQRLLDNIGCISFGRTVKPALTTAKLATTMGTGNSRLIGSPDKTRHACAVVRAKRSRRLHAPGRLRDSRLPGRARWGQRAG